MQNELWSINRRIINCFDTDTGEIFDIEQLESLELERREIYDNLVKERENLLAKIEMRKFEEKRIADGRKNLEDKVARIEKWLSDDLKGNAFESDLFSIKFRASEETECYDIKALLDFDVAGQYFTMGEPKANKKEIKKAIKSGIEVAGCRIVPKQNMQIKIGE